MSLNKFTVTQRTVSSLLGDFPAIARAHLSARRHWPSRKLLLIGFPLQAENNLTALEAEPLPDDIPAIKGLIEDHKEFMDEMQKKEPEVLSICKPSKARPSISQQGKRKSRTSMGYCSKLFLLENASSEIRVDLYWEVEIDLFLYIFC